MYSPVCLSAHLQQCEMRKVTISFVIYVCLSVRPYVRLSFRAHGTSRLALDEFLSNLIFEFFFSKTCREHSSFIKI
jgi:hypothetical protein